MKPKIKNCAFCKYSSYNKHYKELDCGNVNVDTISCRCERSNTLGACGPAGNLFEQKQAKPKKDPTRALLRQAVKLLTVAQSAYSTPQKWAEWNEKREKWMKGVEKVQ
jgi:hypothetical protein